MLELELREKPNTVREFVAEEQDEPVEIDVVTVASVGFDLAVM